MTPQPSGHPRLASDQGSQGRQSHCPHAPLSSWGNPSPLALGSFPLPGLDAFSPLPPCQLLPAVPAVGQAQAPGRRGAGRAVPDGAAMGGSPHIALSTCGRTLAPEDMFALPLRTGGSSSVSSPEQGSECCWALRMRHKSPSGPSLHTRQMVGQAGRWQHHRRGDRGSEVSCTT